MENSYVQANPNVFPCVNCGQCQDACSMEIPLARLTFMLNRELADIFKYESGMDVNAPIPLKSVTDKEINCGWC